MKTLLLLPVLFLFGCSAGTPLANYNATVASRSDSLSGYSKDSGAGGRYTHTVTYR